MASTFSLTGKLGLDARGFVQGAKQAENAIGDVSDEMNDLPDQAGKQGSKAGGLLSSNLAKGFAMAGGAAALAAGFKSVVDAASNLEESTNAVGVAFGEAGADVLAFGADSAKAYGMSQTAFNEAAVGFSAFAQDIAGESGDVAVSLESLISRSTDFASVMNLDVTQAADGFRAALSGEGDFLKRFGIDVSEAAVTAYALSEGIIEAGESMDNATKVQARYGLLMRETAKFQGDFANTSDGLANQQRIIAAQFEDFQASIGTKLLPQLAEYAGVASDILTIATDISNLDFSNDTVDAATGSLGSLADQAVRLGTAGLSDIAPDFLPGADEMGDALNDLTTGFGLWGDSGEETNDVLDTTAIAMKTNADRSADYEDAINSATRAQEQAIQTEEERKKSIDDNVKALQRIVQAQEDARKASEDARMAQLEAIDSSLAYRNQQADTAAAVRDGTEAMNDATLSADEQAQASRDVEAAVLDQAAAAVALAEDQAEANGEMLTAEQKNRTYVEELKTLVGYLNGDAAAAVQGYIDKLSAIPTEITTAVRVTSSGLSVATPAYSDIVRRAATPDAALAGGGPANANRPYLVGEEGPELFIPNISGQVIDAAQTAALFARSAAAPTAQPAPVAASGGIANGNGVTINHYGPNLNASDVSRGYTLARLAQV